MSSNNAILDFADELKHRIQDIDIRTDETSRLLYSTDASIYQIQPLGIVFPKRQADLQAIVETSRQNQVPILARGAGSSLAGQAIGPALIVDCSRYLNKILEIDPDEHSARVEPGVVLNQLNRSTGRYGLKFGPDPASAERATIGGSLANNATGAHSILYGMAADHLLSAEVFFGDGSRVGLGPVSLAEAGRRAARAQGNSMDIEARFYQSAISIREGLGRTIREHWPVTWRRASGYGINYLLPWSATRPPQWGRAMEVDSEENQRVMPYPPVGSDEMNLAKLLAGSEGTLGVISQAKIQLVEIPKNTLLAVLAFASIVEACEAVPSILEHNPSAIELIPNILIRLARSVPAYAQQLQFVNEIGKGRDPEALLVVEFSGEDQLQLRQQASALGEEILIAETHLAQSQVWAVRKVGLGILMSRAGDIKPWSFIEDLAVPVEHLAEFIAEIEQIMQAYGTTSNIYAHASAGCLHVRPLISLKSSQGVHLMRELAEQTVKLTLRLGGSVSGEHGDGIARSEWLAQMYGPEIVQAFRELKQAVDPDWLLNPGKIVSPSNEVELPKMDQQLRFGETYRSKGWESVLSFQSQAGIEGAVEQCNGAGVCRKTEGVMCPSFQATHEELHSTRGRANLLRAMISGKFATSGLAEKSVYQALDLCLACKGCKAECPSAVDMAKLKYEFWAYYYRDKNRRIRDYMFAYIDRWARFGKPFGGIINRLGRAGWTSGIRDKLFGLARQRPLPELQRQSFSQRMQKLSLEQSTSNLLEREELEPVLLLVDAFTEFFYPEAGIAAVRALQLAGCQVKVIPVLGTGRTLISKGFLQAARRRAQKLLETITQLDPGGDMAVVGIEPSEILTLRDEYLEFGFGAEKVNNLAERAWMIDEYLVRESPTGEKRILRIANKLEPKSNPGKPQRVLLHGHCYQKAQPPAKDGRPTGVPATVEMLETLGYTVRVIDSGCCGMAGAFGYESEHYPLSVQVGELALLPAVRNEPVETIIAASGVSCQAQISDEAKRKVAHPITLI